MVITKIISGGQTGVDRAVLDVALALGIPCGGWCPKGRRAEDGVIAERYPLQETPSDDYAERTEWNVRDSDGTLILAFGEPTGGTAFTIACAKRLGKPHLLIDLKKSVVRRTCVAWLRRHNIAVLNVAGPRESHDPGVIASRAKECLRKILIPVLSSPR